MKEITIDQKELEEARRDPRVKKFLVEADNYLIKLETEGRNR